MSKMTSTNVITLQRFVRDAVYAHMLPAALSAALTRAFRLLSVQDVFVVFALMLGLVMPIVLALSWFTSGRSDFGRVRSALVFASGYPYPKYLLFLVLLFGSRLLGTTVATVVFMAAIVPALLSIRLFGHLALRVVDPGLASRVQPKPA